VKCLVFYHPDDEPALREEQERQVLTLLEACRATRHELLLEVIPPKTGGPPADATTVPRAMERFYDVGVHPDWWKLPSPSGEAEWRAIAEVIGRRDPHCRGVLLLGLDAPAAELEAAFALAARQPVCKGVAVGRTVFGGPARAWLKGEMDDEAAVAAMAESYGRLLAAWDRHRPRA
jgi:5-dehydro-2-deoxygluconokinase